MARTAPMPLTTTAATTSPLRRMITVTIAAVIAFYAFTFRVDPDELGI